MRRFLKWIGFILGGVLGLLLLAMGTMFILAGNRLNKTYDIQPEPITISTETAVIERGQYIYSIGCAGCHGDNLAGTPFFDDPALGSIPASNLTAGQGGIGGVYSDADFVRAIRHGVDANSKPLAIMPAAAFYYFSDEDLGAVIAYVQSVPPVDNELGKQNMKLMGRILLAAGAFDVLTAESIDHTGPRPVAPQQSVTADYGEYLVNTGDCRLCHGSTLSGAQPPEPGAPLAPNLTPGGELADWASPDFISTMRIGITPNGHELDAEFMPWEDVGRMTDDDLTAVFLYLQSLPTVETTE
jgi:mono/diheme cytochrome c family protein